MKQITLTPEQWESLKELVLSQLNNDCSLRHNINEQNKWWADNILNGVVPYRIDRIEGRTFEVYFH